LNVFRLLQTALLVARLTQLGVASFTLFVPRLLGSFSICPSGAPWFGRWPGYDDASIPCSSH
jgi:hypothetical protein